MLTGVNFLVEGDMKTMVLIVCLPAMLYTAITTAWAVITDALLTYPVGITFTDTSVICSHLRKNLQSWHGGDNDWTLTVTFSASVQRPGSVVVYWTGQAHHLWYDWCDMTPRVHTPRWVWE